MQYVIVGILLLATEMRRTRSGPRVTGIVGEQVEVIAISMKMRGLQTRQGELPRSPRTTSQLDCVCSAPTASGKERSARSSGEQPNYIGEQEFTPITSNRAAR